MAQPRAVGCGPESRDVPSSAAATVATSSPGTLSVSSWQVIAAGSSPVSARASERAIGSQRAYASGVAERWTSWAASVTDSVGQSGSVRSFA